MNIIRQSNIFKGQQFWRWFKDHSEYFIPVENQVEIHRNQLRYCFLPALHRYCDQLDFEIFATAAGKQQLIITAKG